MSLGDFLFNGSPPPSTTTYGSSIQNMPQWYMDYTQGTINAANSIASQPYQPYVDASGNQIQRIAGLTTDQQAAGQATRDQFGAYQPMISQAAGAMGSVDPNAGLAAGSSNINTASQMNPLGMANPYLGSSYQQGMYGQQAYNSLMGAAGQPGGLSYANPYLSSAYGMNALQTASPYLNQAQGMSGYGAANPYFSQAMGINQVGAAAPWLNSAGSVNALQTASPYLQQAASMRASQAASPYVNAASQTSASQVGQYMSPYLDQVMDRVGDMGARTLREKLMPAIGDTFTRAGQFGSARQQAATGDALRDVNESVIAQQAQLANQGYQQAQQAAGQDLARYGQLGQMMGQLGLGEQQNLANIGQTMGGLDQQRAALLASIGQSMGSLSGQQQQNLTNIGQSAGQLTNQQQQNLANLGQIAGGFDQARAGLYGQLGQTAGSLANQTMQNQLSGYQQAGALSNALMGNYGQLGSVTGNLGVQQMGALGQLGQIQGNLANTGTSNYINANQQLGTLAGQGQTLGLKDAAALQAVGSEQQALNQRNLDMAYQDFMNQMYYPQQQLGWLSNIIRGFEMPRSTSTTQTGPAPYYQPSGLATIASGLGGLYSLFKKDGGAVTHDEFRRKAKPSIGALAKAGC
jgi:hypothetical protein